MTITHQFVDADDNEFAKGYEAAYGEIFATIHLGEAHRLECVDCPPCEVIRTVRREMVNRLTVEGAIVELMALNSLLKEANKNG